MVNRAEVVEAENANSLLARQQSTLDYLQALVGDEFRAAGGLTISRRLSDVLCVAECTMSAPLRESKEEKCPRP
jgi:hypothetical protein